MRRLLPFLLPFLLLLARGAFAEMSEITVAAVVKSFDAETVTVQIRQRELRIPRRQLSHGELRIGTAIFITFRGKQVEELFKGLALNQTARQPASKNSPGR